MTKKITKKKKGIFLAGGEATIKLIS